MTRRIAILVLMVGCLGGCSSLRGVEPPEVSLVNLAAGDVTMFESAGVAHLRIENANPTPITIDGGVHRLYIDGVKVGQAMDGSRITVPRFGSEVLATPMRLNNFQLARVITGMAKAGRFDYKVQSTLYIEREGRKHKLKSSRTGELNFNDMDLSNRAREFGQLQETTQ